MIAPGADVKEGQPVMELETDKAVIEVPSSVSGVVREVRVKEGDKLKVGQVIFTVENGAGSGRSADLATPKLPAPTVEQAAVRKKTDRVDAVTAPPQPSEDVPRVAPVQPQATRAVAVVATEFK